MNFKISKEGLELDVTWRKKDYSVSCKIGQLLLKDYCHMMFMQPIQKTKSAKDVKI